MVVKTFRGLLADDGQDQLRLQTNKGKVGYKIIKFQIMPDDPNQATVHHVMKIFKTSQSTINDSVDFSDSDLLGAATYNEAPGAQDQAGYSVIIFDNEVFNQDIFITNSEPNANQPGNYYLELEVIPLTDHAAEYATLKDIRMQRTIT